MWSSNAAEPTAAQRPGHRTPLKQRNPKKRAQVSGGSAEKHRRSKKKFRDTEARQLSDAPESVPSQFPSAHLGVAPTINDENLLPTDFESEGEGDVDIESDEVGQLQARLEAIQKHKWELFEQYKITFAEITSEFQEIMRATLNFDDEEDSQLGTALLDAQCLRSAFMQAFRVLGARASKH